MKQSLGNLERKLFAYAQLRGITRLYSGDLVKALGITVEQEKKLFTRLAAARMIARVRRGFYLVPKKLPLGGIWTPSEGEALNALIEDKGGKYQICGPNTFNRYGYDEQIPNRVYAYNNRYYGDKTIGAVNLTLIKVADRRLGATEEIRASDGDLVEYSSRVRTLVDAVYDWARFDSLPRGFQWIRSDLQKGRVTTRELTTTALTFGDVATKRRIAYLLEREGAEEKLLKQLEKSLAPTSASIPWNPKKPKRGRLVRRWGVVDNEQD